MIIDQQAQNFAKNKNQEKRKKRLGKTIKLSALFLVGIFVLIFLINLPVIFSKLVKPFQNLPTENYKNASVKLDKRVNLLLITEDSSRVEEIALASYEKGANKAILLKFPSSTLVGTNSEDKSLGALVEFKNGKINNIDKLSSALTVSTGYLIDGYFVVESPKNWISSSFLDQLFTKLYTPSDFFKVKSNKDFLDRQVFTSLTIGDFYTLTTEVKKLEPARFDFIDTNSYLTSDNFIDSQNLKSALGVKFQDSKIANEGSSVEIVNASGEEGIGNVVKNIVTNLGGNVVSVTASDQTQKQSQLLVGQQKFALTERLKTLFKQTSIKQQSNQNGVDIKIIIGQDVANRLSY
ncbi:MAG TPA: LytR C-terminal domain-containing protein [Candidatus Saccharimonadales bacterium]|nr:LytR C-terminal domain-containing protein [Candidatus Saccharimonadales bacterium]